MPADAILVFVNHMAREKNKMIMNEKIALFIITIAGTSKLLTTTSTKNMSSFLSHKILAF